MKNLKAWNIDNQRMDNISMYDFINNGYWVQRGQSSGDGYWVHPPEEFIVLESTGITDKHGVEAYDKDIILIEHKIPKLNGYAWVYWDDGLGAWCVRNKNTSCGLLADVISFSIEGNYYQNNHLLL